MTGALAPLGRLQLLFSFLAMLLGFLSSEPAAAKDLEAVVAFVVPAYVAMNLAAVCVQDDPEFVFRTRSSRGTVFHYAEHIKNEAIASLTDEEAKAILRAAADAARAVVRRQLRSLVPDYPFGHPGELAGWCKDRARKIVRSVIVQHDGQHSTILRELERAKQ